MTTIHWDTEIEAAASHLVSRLGANTEVTPRRRLSGKSGAHVYSADVAGGEALSGEFIIKFEVRTKTTHGTADPTETRSEADLNHEARSVNPAFAAKHIPEVLLRIRYRDVDITIVRVAEGGIEYIQPLEMANADSLPVLLQNLSHDLLSAWARNDPGAATPIVSPAHIMQEWLGNRLDVHSEGRLNTFLVKHGLSPTAKSFALNGELLPNPASLCQSEGIGQTVQMRPLKGYMHGDMHYQNILHVPGSTSIYHIIDFTHFQADRPVLFDHAYLEVSTLLNMLSEYPIQEWVELISKLPGIAKPQDIPGKKLLPREQGLVHPLMFIRERAFAWFKGSHPDRLSQLDNQYRLARIAAGLNFACKINLPDKMAINAFIYAALEAREFFAFNKLPLPSGGGAPQFTIEVGGNANGAWRDLWKRGLDFDSTRSAYVLCGDLSENSDLGRQIDFIPRLPFCMIIDVAADGSKLQIYEKARSIALKSRAFHVNFPTDQPKLAFDRSVVWLTLLGNVSAPASVVSTPAEWRRRYRAGLQKWIAELRMQLFPKRVVLVLSPQAGRFLEVFDRVWEDFDQVLAEHLTTVTLSCPGIGADSLPIDLRSTLSEATAEDIREGVLYLQGADRSQPNAVYLPRRLPDREASDTGIRREIFVCDDLANIRYIEEEFELVHRGLAARERIDHFAEPAFLRGNEISWVELDAGIDVRRDVSSELEKLCERRLENYSNDTVEFRHHPGSGGTTVVRRLAWEMKERFPTLMLKSISGETADRVSQLYALCGLPVLLIADGGILSSEADRERLFREIRARNTRCLILHVFRGTSTSQKVPALQDPMGSEEASRFLARYAMGLPLPKQAILKQLAYEPEHNRYRSAFFFGLYAFEEKFTHVQDFVMHQLQGLAAESRRALKYVALVSCYAQSPLTLDQLAGLLGIEDPHRSIAEEVIGEGGHRLIAIGEDRSIRAVHPVLAKEILKVELGGLRNNGTDESWKLRLVEVAKELIEGFATFSTEQDARTSTLLEQLFINREPWSEVDAATKSSRGAFSPLVMDIQDPASQSVLLATLTERFPKEPHYWSHRGRHSNLILHERYERAEEFIKNAIHLSEGRDPIHHHSLGMVYRFEIRRILREAKKATTPRTLLNQADIEQTWEQIQDLFAHASDCFLRSRHLDPESDYGYITAVQLPIEVIRGLRDLHGYTSVTQLLAAKSKVGRWARVALQDCEQVFDELKERHAQDAPSHLAVKCDGELKELYGDFNGMINDLRGLLEHPDTEHSVTRRLISKAYLAKRKNNWAMLEPKELRTINTLALENLERSEPMDQDYWHWFQSFRRLPEYDDAEARRRLMVWAQSRNSTQANYYLYVLHFIRWYTGESHDLSAMQRHLAQCGEERASGQNSWSAEWLGNQSLRCQMVHFGELGEWGDGHFPHRFYSQTANLERVIGMVADISRPQAGEILIYPKKFGGTDYKPKPVRAFFAPGNDFRPGRDENREVEFHLGFSRVGLRAWSVAPVTRSNGI